MAAAAAVAATLRLLLGMAWVLASAVAVAAPVDAIARFQLLWRVELAATLDQPLTGQAEAAELLVILARCLLQEAMDLLVLP